MAKEGERAPISPVARRMAEEHGVDLTRMKGTGPGGRIVRADIEKAIDEATEKVKNHTGNRMSLILEVINPLQAKLREGTKGGLYCSEKRIQNKFKKLESTLKKFDASHQNRKTKCNTTNAKCLTS